MALIEDDEKWRISSETCNVLVVKKFVNSKVNETFYAEKFESSNVNFLSRQRAVFKIVWKKSVEKVLTSYQKRKKIVEVREKKYFPFLSVQWKKKLLFDWNFFAFLPCRWCEVKKEEGFLFIGLFFRFFGSEIIIPQCAVAGKILKLISLRSNVIRMWKIFLQRNLSVEFLALFH